jgi:hypothetical protein
VFKQISTAIIGMVFLAGMGMAQTAAPADPAAAQKQADADAYNALLKETDPVKKLAALDDWSQKVPDTKFKTERNVLYIDAYSRIGAMSRGPNATPDQFKAAESANQTLIDKADTLFDPAMKTANATPEQWLQAKAGVLLVAHQSLIAGYAAKKDTLNLEKEYMKMIALEPGKASWVSLLAAAIVSEGKVDRRPDAYYQYARALSITGPDALDAATRKQTDEYLTRAYKGYHGDTKGLDEMKALAAKSPMPPADFHIESVTDISKRDIAADQEFVNSHPEIMSWRAVKAALTAPDGDDYFNKGLKGAAFPKTKAKVVSQPSAKELTVSVDNATPETALKAEATLKFLDATIKGTVAPGTEITFTDAGPASVTKDPFMIVFEVEKANVEGVELAPAVATKKAPVRHKKTTPK